MKKSKIFIPILFIFIFLVLSALDLSAQCPMCRMAAESNLDHGGSMGKGLNRGILYMLALPYTLVATIAYIWYRHRKKQKDYPSIPE